MLDEIYLSKKWSNLSEFNIATNKLLAKTLAIKVEFVNSKNLNSSGSKDDKLIDICQKLGGTHYLSGPAAKVYIDQGKFDSAQIELEYMTYDYPEYQQLYGEFDHFVTILDLIFNCGSESGKFIFQQK